MTFEEYKEQSIKAIRKSLRGFEKQEVEDYMKKLEENDCYRKSYNEDAEAEKILGSVQTSPEGFAYGIRLMYPEVPYTDIQNMWFEKYRK